MAYRDQQLKNMQEMGEDMGIQYKLYVDGYYDGEEFEEEELVVHKGGRRANDNNKSF